METENKNVKVGGGVSTFTVLGIVFIILKLCGVITWPWLWVLSPFWIPAAIFIVCFLVGVLVGVVLLVNDK